MICNLILTHILHDIKVQTVITVVTIISITYNADVTCVNSIEK